MSLKSVSLSFVTGLHYLTYLCSILQLVQSCIFLVYTFSAMKLYKNEGLPMIIEFELPQDFKI